MVRRFFLYSKPIKIKSLNQQINKLLLGLFIEVLEYIKLIAEVS